MVPRQHPRWHERTGRVTDYDAPASHRIRRHSGHLPRTALRQQERHPVSHRWTSKTPTPQTRSNYPGADLSGEQLTVRVISEQSDEVTCISCSWSITAADLPTSSSRSAATAPETGTVGSGRSAGTCG
ncbi:DUF4193 family protein [Rhodococcus opacus]|uniref:DUF4193 family protein n=1 Tax=Rhodococcus opacus TaxID=37919 RepID=UPI003D2A70CE